MDTQIRFKFSWKYHIIFQSTWQLLMGWCLFYHLEPSLWRRPSGKFQVCPNVISGIFFLSIPPLRIWAILEDNRKHLNKLIITVTSLERHDVTNHRKFDYLFNSLLNLTTSTDLYTSNSMQQGTSKLGITCSSVARESTGGQWIHHVKPSMQKPFLCHDVIMIINRVAPWLCMNKYV